MTTKKSPAFGGLTLNSESTLLRRFGPYVLYGLITLLVIVLYVDNHRLLASWELGLQDKMVSLGRRPEPPSDVAVVQIDDSAIAKLGPWPWNSERIGYLVGMLAEYKPKAIGLDVELPTRTDEDSSGNLFLAEIVSRVGNVVLPLRFTLSDEGRYTRTAPEFVTKSSLTVIDEAARLLNYPYPQSINVNSPFPEASKAALGLGHVNTWQDIDGRVRRDPLVVCYEGNYYPSMALRLACVASGTRLDQVHIEPGEALVMGSKRIPTDEFGMMRIDYRGPAGTVPSISAAQVLEGQANARDLTGKILVVGVAATGYGATLRTSTSSAMPRAEKLATVTADIMADRYIGTVAMSSLLDLMILIAIGAVCGFVMPRTTLVNRIVVLVVLGFLTVNINYVLFHSFRLVTNTLYPSLEILFFLAFAPFVKQHAPERHPELATRVSPLVKESRPPAAETMPMSTRASTSGSSRYAASLPPTATAETAAMPSSPAPRRASSGGRKVAERSGGSESFNAGITLTPSFDPTAADEPAPSQTVATPAMPEPVELGDEPTNDSGKTVLMNLKRLGRYEILGVLGQGAMGVVFKGKDPAIDRLVALKTIRIGVGIDKAQSAELRARLIREAKAAGKLSHPNIVTIYDVGTEGDIDYIAMEYLEGYPLEDLVEKRTTVNYRIIAKMLHQVCSALDYAHKAGIVHRDIKPANVMVLDDYQIKVTDFGIARFESGQMSMTQTGIAMGTPYYIAPEQLRGEAIDRRCDIFSLGVVAYELLTRRRPFDGQNISALIYSITQTNPEAPSKLDPNIPGLFDMIIGRALAKDPRERYQSAEDMGKDLEAFVEDMAGAKSFRR
jgi:serine/threonine-protein kinase